jgi:hypothetical protein
MFGFRLAAFFATAVLTGCATVVEMPDLPLSHPANPEAEAPPAMRPSGLLSLHHPPPPNTKPSADPAQHDHMQQRGHGSSSHGEAGGMSMGMGHDGMSGKDHGMSGEFVDPGTGEAEMSGSSKTPMKHAEGSGSKMGGMVHDRDELPHDHESETSPPQHGPMHGRAKSGRIYRCPKHLVETSPYNGNCMRCGEVMEPVVNEIPQSVEQHGSMPTESQASPYRCTVHNDLAFSSPGLCPVCGMTLIEREDSEQ